MGRKKEKTNKNRFHSSEDKLLRLVEETGRNTFVGVVVLGPRSAYITVDHKMLRADVEVSFRNLKSAQYGDKVLVRLTSWKSRSRHPQGEVVEVLGHAGENETEMHAILAEFGLPYSYPEALEREAEEINDEISQAEIYSRLDMRDVTTFTIDPADAKDFDDALSIKVIEEEYKKQYEIGVHIADVTHYVKEDTVLDREAYERGTSVYLVDRTVPMLPERLSNGICSLRPQEDKLTFSVIFRIDENANVLTSKIKRTVINSNRRFNYDEAQQRIETGEGDYAEELRLLNSLALRLRERRFENGAVNFMRDEVRFDIDEKGRPVDIHLRESKEANWLIEEFMLLANKTVAEFVGKKSLTEKLLAKENVMVYRVHDVPEEGKLNDFAQFIKKFGYNLKQSKKKETNSRNLNKLLSAVQGKPEQELIETLAIRSMAKAVYSTDNIGHYGLAFRYYTHFTSPIRRYPDMMVHRLLTKYLKGKTIQDKDAIEQQCQHCSAQEQLAAQAERQSVHYKQVEYMSERIGQEYDGFISGVTEWGVYVEMDDNHCEGMVPIRELSENDYFVFNEKEYQLEGTQTGAVYRLGDRVRVRVVQANIPKRQLDLVLLSKY